jgi:flagellar P-ring protein precursor FlgI
MKIPMKRNAKTVVPGILFVGLLFFASFLRTPYADAERIKDIARFEGVRENQVIGFGLVTGLDGTGDKGLATVRGVANMLQRMGLTVRPLDIKAKNVAAVMVTAQLPPFPKPGVKVDVLVSTIGDATSIQGGTLLLTPMKGPDGKVYGLAQGPLSLGGFVASSGGSTVQKNHPTAGRVPEGMIIEREPPFNIAEADQVRLFLNRPDLTTAVSVAKTINEAFNANLAAATDPSGVTVAVPQDYKGRAVQFMSLVEGLKATVDVQARVVVNERTGTVVIGENVRLSPVALAHGSLTIDIKTSFNVSQPPPFGSEGSRTVVVPDSDVSVKEQKAALSEVAGATLGEIVKALNALGVTPRDLIAILQALRSAGALRAELEIM